MSNESDTLSFVQVYKPKLWVFLANVGSLFFSGIVIGLPLLLLLTISISVIQSESDISIIEIGFMGLLAPIIILMSLLLVKQLVGFISQFFSYVKVSSVGLEQKFWPYKHIRCNWSDVDKIGKWWLFYDVVYLNSCEIIGPSISLRVPLRLFRFPLQNFITLSGYQGWSDGQLAEDIRRFVPRLFETELGTQEAMSGSELNTQQSAPEDKQLLLHPSGLSQEERLLAALSHGSVFFSYVGIIAPIVIWATQKGKSAYTEFQALQALILQAVVLIFNLLFTACFMGAIFVPILMTLLVDNDAVGGVAFSGMFVAIMIMSFLMPFGYFAFMIYGIVGAIMTYQGKDFRYAVIANRLEKRGIIQQRRP
jgi:uncharacterized Tic20 family protein